MSDKDAPAGSPAILLTERREGVLIITLNRTHARNAFDLALALALEQEIDRFESDRDLRVAIITGAQGHFSAGADLKAAQRGEIAITEKRGAFGLSRRAPAKPVIAAVEGYALGGGFELAISCDLIVAAESARFGLPEVSRGVVAVGGALFRLPRRAPYHFVMELALTGEIVTPASLERHGLVNRVVPAGEALDAALELATRIAANAPLAVKASKQIMRMAFEWSDHDAWDSQWAFALPALNSEDAREGPRAFVEKRAPAWTGT